MKAHQRVIREREEARGNWPTGSDGNPLVPDIATAEVKAVPRALAKRIIEQYEWLGKMAAVNWYYYGIFFDGVCGGVVVYGPEYIENLGRWDPYGYTGKIILLSRGACAHWAHPHAASKLIRQSMRMLPPQFKVVTCTVDDLAGEIGTIYQACGFDYVGSMRDANPNVKSRKGDRMAWLLGNRIISPRQLRSKCGATRWEEVIKHYPDIKRVKQNSKSRYFAFRGSKKEQRELRGAIAHLIKPYPKRPPEQTEAVPPHLAYSSRTRDERQLTLF